MSGILTYAKAKPLNQIVLLQVDEIHVNRSSSECPMDHSELQALMCSIEKNGMSNPLNVRLTEKGYELLAGEQRLHAARLAGLQHVPCVICEMNRQNTAIKEIVEHIQGENLHFFEEASAIEKLISFYGITQEDAASHLGRAQSTVANKLRLLRLTEEERNIIITNHLTERHARALLRLGAPQERMVVLNQVIRYGLNVEKTEQAVEQMIGKNKRREPYRKRSRTLRNIRSFVSALSRSVDTMRNTGIAVQFHQLRKDKFVEFNIRIPISESEDFAASNEHYTY